MLGHAHIPAGPEKHFPCSPITAWLHSSPAVGSVITRQLNLKNYPPPPQASKPLEAWGVKCLGLHFGETNWLLKRKTAFTKKYK